mmetsp:Transcript_5018/g.10421  ORF Transcript_5018/g.10421 Transcript_5018/m.10421 type:complete len:228 (-) Transcript_5018:1084-1767(-)
MNEEVLDLVPHTMLLQGVLVATFFLERNFDNIPVTDVRFKFLVIKVNMQTAAGVKYLRSIAQPPILELPFRAECDDGSEAVPVLILKALDRVHDLESNESVFADLLLNIHLRTTCRVSLLGLHRVDIVSIHEEIAYVIQRNRCCGRRRYNDDGATNVKATLRFRASSLHARHTMLSLSSVRLVHQTQHICRKVMRAHKNVDAVPPHPLSLLNLPQQHVLGTLSRLLP